MAYLQELITQQTEIIQQQQINAANFFGNDLGAYSSYFPTWEVTAPQYIQPQVWSLSQLGYRTNEVAYACINLWMKTVSEPTIKVYDKNTNEIINDHPLYEFMREPCPDLSETDFWNAIEMYLKIAGFMAWEKDTANNGDLINVWPMMPQYCSFMRGQQQLLRSIRYLPYTGLPAYDIPRERFIFFSYVDPLYYGLRPFSPTAVLADIIGVDNDMTKMLQQFIKNGAFVSGLLKTDQILNEADARFAKERFRESHGGPNNAGDVVVVGKGLEYQPMGQTFRDMVFPELDARSETRICQGYSVKPILISAKVGMDRSTYNNYEQARQAWYDEDVTSEWAFLAHRVTRDLLPHFDKNPNHECRFDIRNVRALQEDRNKKIDRVVNLAKANVITRDETRIEIGKDAIDNEPIFIGLTTQQQLAETQNIFEPGGGEEEVNEQGQLTAYGENEEEEKEKLKLQKEKLKQDQDEEEKHFRAFAKRRLKEKKLHDIGEFEFKHIDEKHQRKLMTEFGVPDPSAEMVLKALLIVVEQMNKPQDLAIKAVIDSIPASTNNIYIDVPEQKASAPVVNVTNEVQPTPINVEVSPTPINNKVEVKTPKLKRQYQKVKRDNNFNMDGTISEFEYEDDK